MDKHVRHILRVLLYSQIHTTQRDSTRWSSCIASGSVNWLLQKTGIEVPNKLVQLTQVFRFAPHSLKHIVIVCLLAEKSHSYYAELGKIGHAT